MLVGSWVSLVQKKLPPSAVIEEDAIRLKNLRATITMVTLTSNDKLKALESILGAFPQNYCGVSFENYPNMSR